MILIGNEDVDWVEQRLDVTFYASFTDPDGWHAFELPSRIVFGSYK